MHTLKYHPIITVVRNPSNSLGKSFEINSDGTLRKESHVRLSFGLAMQHHVSSHKDLAKLFEEVGEDRFSAIINASFPEIPIGEEFAILSEREIEDSLGISGADRTAQQGVHRIEFDGKAMKAVGRFKENVRPSNWQLLDRDVDSHTPDQFAGLSTEEWLSELSTIVPGVDQISYVWIPSASSRVLRDGVPVGRGNGHIWIYVADTGDMERARATIILRA